ncbi:MAG: hypothetical protein V4469_02160 [Patescibacteria group bacterium]
MKHIASTLNRPSGNIRLGFLALLAVGGISFAVFGPKSTAAPSLTDNTPKVPISTVNTSPNTGLSNTTVTLPAEDQQNHVGTTGNTSTAVALANGAINPTYVEHATTLVNLFNKHLGPDALQYKSLGHKMTAVMKLSDCPEKLKLAMANEFTEDVAKTLIIIEKNGTLALNKDIKHQPSATTSSNAKPAAIGAGA